MFSKHSKDPQSPLPAAVATLLQLFALLHPVTAPNAAYHWLVLISCASPLETTLTPDNIVPVMKEVRCWWKIVADPVKDRIKRCYSTETERSCEAGKYWVHTCPFASWEDLALKLYYAREDRALEKVAQYLPRGTYILSLLPSALARGSEWGIYCSLYTYVRTYVRTWYVPEDVTLRNVDRNVAGFLPAN